MIYITGDTHGDPNRFLCSREEKTWTQEDTVIICGDFGFLFENNESENAFLDALEARPYTVAFIDGNHENFPAIFSYPEEQWNGGRVQRIRRNILHLMRGQIYSIEGKKIFTFGGGYSRDRMRRKLNVSFWNEELPSSEEYHEAVRNLREHGNRVDIVLTHTGPKGILRRMGWGIEDGLVLVMAIGDEDYYAIASVALSEHLRASDIQEILDEELEPDFAAGDYDAGARKVYAAFCERIEELYEQYGISPEEEAGWESGTPSGDGASGEPVRTSSSIGRGIRSLIMMIVWIVLIILIVVILAAVFGGRRGGPRSGYYGPGYVPPPRRRFFGRRTRKVMMVCPEGRQV